MKLTGINHKLSTSYHPQTDGSSEWLNKTVVQCLHFHVECNLKGWAKALPKVQFDIMNSIIASTGIYPFILKTGRSPWLIPPLIALSADRPCRDLDIDMDAAHTFVEAMEEEMNTAKIQQAHFTNKDQLPEPTFSIGDKVFLATAH